MRRTKTTLRSLWTFKVTQLLYTVLNLLQKIMITVKMGNWVCLVKKGYFGASLSIRSKQISQELKGLTSFSKQRGPAKVYDRKNSAASHALKFISKSTGSPSFSLCQMHRDEQRV